MSGRIVLVTGCARSGTSMVAGVLHTCGLNFGGPLVGPSPHNPRGFFEHRAIRQKVLKPYLEELGCDARGQRVLPPRGLLVHPTRVARFRRAVLKRLGGAVAYKDAKVLLTWPMWKAAFPEARWVLVRRDAKAIVASCIRTPFMKGRPFKQGWIEWVQDHEQRLADLKASGVDFHEVWPDPTEPEVFQSVAEWCGLIWDPVAVSQFLVPNAWHVS